MISDVEVLITLLPEVFGVVDQAARNALLEGFECVG
jgi:hypothetical protein